MIKYKSLNFNFTPESLVFASPANEPTELVIGLRGVPYLIYLDVTNFEQRSVSINENEWDTHVSFTPLFLSISPDQKYILIATDKNMHIVLRRGTNRRVRTLTGHSCGDYGKPYALWDHTGKYIYCNSEEENALYVYSVASQRVVERLRGHSGIIRAIAVHPQQSIVTTASYDKSVGIWKSKS